MTIFKSQPKALTFLFLTELWERFGFYVVQGMLVLYMTKSFGFSDEKSFTILGMFTALAYIAPMVGGYIADTFLGFKLAIVWGAVFLIAGYALLSLSGWSNGFYISLATIIVGTGLFKPNISSLLGTLYGPHDSGRDAGFTIFYIGINLGILLAGLTSGAIRNYFGWHVSFALASVGLIIGMIIFSLGLKWGDIKIQPFHRKKGNDNFLLSKPLLITYCVLSIGVISQLLRSSVLGTWLLPVFGIGLIAFMLILSLKQEATFRRNLLILNILILSSIIFWMIYWQMFFSVNLFIDRLVDRTIFNIKIPTTAFYTLEALFIILLGTPMAWSWQVLSANDKNPTPFVKFIIAIACLGFAFLVLTSSTYFQDSNYLINPLWIVAAYFLITIGEMLLSPIGLSAVTTLSPPHLTGMMMGVWFVALGFGGQFAGLLAKLSSVDGGLQDITSQLVIYRQAFLYYSLLAFIVALVLFGFQFFFKRFLKPV